MRNLKRLIAVALILVLALSMASCYVISAQSMRNVKGTYKLTTYTYTPSYERKEGYTPRTYDYINDAEYMYEDYLVITGTNTGYYVHKEASGDCYVKEVTLSYQYSTENTSKIEYVIHNDSLTVNKESEFNKMGVTKNHLNYSKAAIDYTQLITKKPMRTESMTVRWEKVSKKTDLSYVESQIPELKNYGFKEFSGRGIYELSAMLEASTGTYIDTGYQYLFYLVDTADGVTTGKLYYALKETPTEQVVRTVSFSNAEDLSTLTVDGKVWTLEPDWGNYYISVDGEIESRYTHISNSISESTVEEFISQKLPTVTE